SADELLHVLCAGKCLRNRLPREFDEPPNIAFGVILHYIFLSRPPQEHAIMPFIGIYIIRIFFSQGCGKSLRLATLALIVEIGHDQWLGMLAVPELIVYAPFRTLSILPVAALLPRGKFVCIRGLVNNDRKLASQDVANLFIDAMDLTIEDQVCELSTFGI